MALELQARQRVANFGAGSDPVPLGGGLLPAPAAKAAVDQWVGGDRPTRAAHQQALIEHAKRMVGRDAPEIWASVAERAIAYQRGSGQTPRQQLTAVMEDLGVALNGRDLLQHLEDYCSKAWLWRADEPAASRDRLKALGVANIAPPGDLDVTETRTFRPEFADGSRNQIYHANFYFVMGYLTRDVTAIRVGSMVHESRDDGSSRPDHAVAMAGARLGAFVWSEGQSSDADATRLLRDLPAFIGGAFGSSGKEFIQPAANTPVARAAAAEGDWLARDFIEQDRAKVDADWNSKIPKLRNGFRSKAAKPLQWLLGKRLA